jgi:hypothetical protein
MPWSHAASQWGARVWGVVASGRRQLNTVRGYYPEAQLLLPEGGQDFSKGRMWRGVAAFTWRTTVDLELLIRTLGSLWPGVCLVTAPGNVGKRVLERKLAGNGRLAKIYLGRIRHRKIRHSEIGGVTRSVWSVWCLVHREAPASFRVNLDWTLVPYQRWVGADLNPVTKYRRMELEITQERGETLEPGVMIVGHVIGATWRQAGVVHQLPGGGSTATRGYWGKAHWLWTRAQGPSQFGWRRTRYTSKSGSYDRSRRRSVL